MQHRNWPLFPWLFALWGPIWGPTVDAFRLICSWISSLHRGYSLVPPTGRHRPRFSDFSQISPQIRAVGQMCLRARKALGDVFCGRICDRLKYFLPSVVDWTVDLQLANTCCKSG